MHYRKLLTHSCSEMETHQGRKENKIKTQIWSIYLPQFHTIPENDNWWGKGFTEWTNVKRGVPFYPGHYQPREPLDNNYYDLADLKVLEKHTQLAKKAGISGFCFYHYYFMGKKLLEKPIENYRDNSKEKFPYCLIWANQSWERTWYGEITKNTTLLRQKYGVEKDWVAHFYYLLDFFKDERYLKIGNKPVYILYIPQKIKLRRQMFAIWNKLAKDEGFKGLYLIAMNTCYGKDYKSSLYDAYMEFEPLSLMREDGSWRKHLDHWKQRHTDAVRKERCNLLNWIWARNAYTYTYLCRAIEKKAKQSDTKTFSGVFAGWDNTSRKDEAGIVVRGNNPRIFQRHILKMLRLAEMNEKEFVFLNAWNEWSEGAYIEPDKKYGYAYLRALKNAIDIYDQG